MMKRAIFYLAILFYVTSCSHDYDSNTLDLGFYQWNLWPDQDADPDNSGTLDNSPSCSWEVLHRGTGKLVRIPNRIADHFTEEEYSGVTWYHCRFTLPELWAEKQILLKSGGAGLRSEVYLNEKLVDIHEGAGQPFEIDLTGIIFYTRDNHLTIRIVDPERERAGLSGSLVLKAVDPEGHGDPEL